MDISTFYNISSPAIKRAVGNTSVAKENTASATQFGSIFDQAVSNLNITNSYLSDAENEKVKWALGETDNSHELSIALQKASTSLQYTVAIRDKVLEAYKELMQMQI